MTLLLVSLARAVRAAPGVLVAVTLLLTGVFGALSTQAVQEAGFENFAPDNEVSATFAAIDERFGTGTQPTQVVVQRAEGALLDGTGIAAALDLRSRIDGDDRVTSALAPVPDGAVITYADLTLQAAAEQGLDPGSLPEGAGVELHEAAVAALAPEQAAQVAGLIGGDPAEATVGSVVVLFDGGLPEPDRLAAVRALDEIVVGLDGVDADTLDFALLAEDINEEITADLGRLLGLAFLLIIVILSFVYRRFSDVIASLLGLVFTIVWMQGASVLVGPGYLGWTGGQSEMAMAIPILLVGLGVDYGIHLTMRYREERGLGSGPPAAAGRAIGAVGTALLLATITTVVGFATNVFNPLPPLQDFGVFAALGVVSAFLVFTTFVPSVRVLLDRRAERRGRLRPEVVAGTTPSLLGRLAGSLAPLATERPRVVLAVAGLLTLAGAAGATQLSTEFSQTEFFPADSEPLQLIERVEEELGGDLTERTRVLVTGDLATPGSLAALDAVERDAAAVPGVRGEGRAQVDSVLARALAAGIVTPQEVAADGAADLAALGGRVAAVDPSVGAVLADDAVLVEFATNAGDEAGELRDGLLEVTEPLRELGLEVGIASDGLLIDTVLEELRASQISGLGITLLASMAILSLVFWIRVREPLLGVLAILAVAIVVAWTLGLMALVGIPFNVMTAMVSALAIGIGVPFGIHVVNRFIEDRDREPDLDRAVASTLRNTGGALVGSAATTVAGFGALVLSSVPPFRQFGLVVAMTITLALVASVAVLPSMLVLYTRARAGRDHRASGSSGAGPGTGSDGDPAVDDRVPVG